MEPGADPISFGTVLVAIDGSEDSERILDYVAALASMHQSDVIVFHVRQLAYSGVSTLHVGRPPVISVAEAADRLRDRDINARGVEEDAYWADTADAIIEAADKNGAKAIVIGTRGRGKVSAALLGSVAYKVLHLADRPVLVIP